MRKASKKLSVPLTEADKLILKSYCTLADCLKVTLGRAYQIAVHSFGEGDRFTLKLVNAMGNSQLPDVQMPESAVSAVEQLLARVKHGDTPVTVSFGIASDGRMYKSSSAAIVNDGRMIGMLCVNCCLEVPISEVIRTFSLPSYLDTALPVPVSDASRYDAVLSQTIIKTRDSVMSDDSVPAKFKRKEIVRQLNEAGVFKVKNAIQICADTLGITIATIYMHLRNLEI